MWKHCRPHSHDPDPNIGRFFFQVAKLWHHNNDQDQHYTWQITDVTRNNTRISDRITTVFIAWEFSSNTVWLKIYGLVDLDSIFSIRYSITAVDDGIMLRNCRRRTAGSAFLHVNNSSLPFAAAVGSTNRTRNGWSVEVAQELRVRHAHLKGQVLTQLKAIVTERRKRRGNKQYSEFQHVPIKNNNNSI